MNWKSYDGLFWVHYRVQPVKGKGLPVTKWPGVLRQCGVISTIIVNWANPTCLVRSSSFPRV